MCSQLVTGGRRNSRPWEQPPPHPFAPVHQWLAPRRLGRWLSPAPQSEGPFGCFRGAAPPRMAALVVNKPGPGLDSGRQGGRGPAMVKVRDLAFSVVHHWPAFGPSRRGGCGAAALAASGAACGLWAPLGFTATLSPPRPVLRSRRPSARHHVWGRL